MWFFFGRALSHARAREQAANQTRLERELTVRDEELDELKSALGLNAPPEFVCAISHEIMVDPVFTADGMTYERACISDWFATGATTSPATNQLLENFRLTPNHSMRASISRLLRASAGTVLGD